ncbi:ESX secretion-associated protein EspG [Actinosynnema sp. NPDC020468]|uniref:ESX secretion-associated protein EspG n=1 Tax=Actinosynnema sp. NPDC020468 TaxID=3154488 RepID=UPI0033E9C13E
MLRETVTLTELAYDVLWRHDELGPQHSALAVDSPGATHTERERLVDAVFRDLEQDGLADRRTPRSDVRRALAVLAEPDSAYYGWFAAGPGRPATAVAATSRHGAVLATRSGGLIRLRGAAPDRPAEALVGRLPAARPGRGLSLNLRDTEVRDDRSLDGRTLRRMMAEPRLGVATLHTSRRDRVGRTLRAAEFLTVLDLPTGRWLVTTETDPAGQRWIMVNPGDDHTVARHLYRLNRSA